MGKRVKITKTTVDNLPVDSLAWDTECTGFHVRRQKSDARTYAVFYRTWDGRQRFCKIGRHGSPLTVDEARKKAREILVDVGNGKDPAGDRYDDRKAANVSELCDLYLGEAAAGRILKRGRSKKASTLLTDRSRIEHVKRVLGHLKVASVTDRDVERLRDAVSAGTATRTLGMLGAIFQFAVKRGMRSVNPVRGVDRPAGGVRTRRMSPGGIRPARRGSARTGANYVAAGGRGCAFPLPDRLAERRGARAQVGRGRSCGQDGAAPRHEDGKVDAGIVARRLRCAALTPATGRARIPISARQRPTNARPGGLGRDRPAR